MFDYGQIRYIWYVYYVSCCIKYHDLLQYAHIIIVWVFKAGTGNNFAGFAFSELRFSEW